MSENGRRFGTGRDRRAVVRAPRCYLLSPAPHRSRRRPRPVDARSRSSRHPRRRPPRPPTSSPRSPGGGHPRLKNPTRPMTWIAGGSATTGLSAAVTSSGVHGPAFLRGRHRQSRRLALTSRARLPIAQPGCATSLLLRELFCPGRGASLPGWHPLALAMRTAGSFGCPNRHHGGPTGRERPGDHGRCVGQRRTHRSSPDALS